MKKKALVLYSGGLDSRLAVKLLQEEGYEIEALHFALPFGCGCCDLNCNFKFTQMNDVKLTVFDCNKGELFEEYIELLKNPKYGTGSGANPCRDCKVFMFKKAKEYADSKKIKVIATGEVTGQRPMTQTPGAMKVIDNAIGFELKRPLIEAGIRGRNRGKQMELAKKFNMKYPTPGGGCLLCESELERRFNALLQNDLIKEDVLSLVYIGRHFFLKGVWFIVARDKRECEIIEKFKTVVEGVKGKPSVYYSLEKGKKDAEKLQEAYRTGAERKERDKFGKWKI
jgi:tRNA-uridine 2-sulfurtransferase